MLIQDTWVKLRGETQGSKILIQIDSSGATWETLIQLRDLFSETLVNWSRL